MRGRRNRTWPPTALASRSAPISEIGIARWILIPSATPGAPTSSGGDFRCRSQNMRRWNRAWGTTVAMTVSRTALGSKPASAMSWLSHTMYSSAVRALSVRMRQSPTMRPSSNRPNFTFVLLALMASSIGVLSGGGRRIEYVAGRHQATAAFGQLQLERAGGIEGGEAALQRGALQADLDRSTQPRREFEPTRAHRREAGAPPEAVPMLQPVSERLQQVLDGSAAAGGAYRSGGIGKPFGMARQVDADAQHQDDRLLPQRLGLQENAGDFGAVDQEIIGPFAAYPPLSWQEGRQRLGQGNRGEEADLRRLAGASPRAQQNREIEIARRRGPPPTAAAAAAGLFPRPDQGPFRRAGLGQAPGLQVRAADHPPNRDFAATSAADSSGPGRKKNSRTASPVAAVIAMTSPPLAGSNSTVASSKYMTLTTRR